MTNHDKSPYFVLNGINKYKKQYIYYIPICIGNSPVQLHKSVHDTGEFPNNHKFWVYLNAWEFFYFWEYPPN